MKKEGEDRTELTCEKARRDSDPARVAAGRLKAKRDLGAAPAQARAKRNNIARLWRERNEMNLL